MDHDTVEKLIIDLVRERFKDAEINSVEVDEDVDFDGDEILRVKVVFTAADNRLDSGLTSSFLRYLRPKLSEIGVRQFPVMSFVSHNDSGGVAA